MMEKHIPAVLPDTNFLLDFPSFYREKWLLSPLEILISETVLAELRGLAKNHDPQRAKKARQALADLEKFQGSLAGLSETEYHLKVCFVDRFTDIQPPLEATKADHQLIAYARSLLTGTPRRFCAIASNDKELTDIAEALSVIVVNRQNEHRFHQELKRKHDWWIRIAGDKLQGIPARETPPKPPIASAPLEKHLDRCVRELYRRIRSVGFRATVYLAPVGARIRLALELIRRARNPSQNTMLVFVQSPEDAQYWAAEIRQQGRFPASQVQVFGAEPADHLEDARIILYRHDQVTRRLPQHVARLKQIGKRPIAVVDGCDMLDPVELAILLYECDQFIGLNHFPTGYKQARGHRMLSILLHNRSILDYTFADAERDGWGHPCDPYFNKLEFTSEERELWDQINNDYLNTRERLVRLHPELGGRDDFWESLDALIKRGAEPTSAKLIELREQREAMAAIAGNKLEQVLRLTTNGHHKPYRCVIFDNTRHWTPVLMKQMESTGHHTAQLLENDQQRVIWDRFAGNQVDVLFLHKRPQLDLPKAYIHQMIILTPLCPMDELIAAIDWVLSHTMTKEALCLNLLYIDDSPEELAMLELAEAGFGLLRS